MSKISAMAVNRALLTGLALLLAACGNGLPDGNEGASNHTPEQAIKPKLGLMTSLPLYWPLGVEFSDMANGEAAIPWQREVFQQSHDLVLLDTLTPIASLAESEPEVDPLEGLERLAIIQPRGLAPADNVALDEWVRAGGQLLIALDPLLTGHYDLALGDLRRPSGTALIPPVVPRWGMTISSRRFDNVEAGFFTTQFAGVTIELGHPGSIELDRDSEHSCRLVAGDVIARCEIGKGSVTLLADAAVFESEGQLLKGHDHDEDDHHDHGDDEEILAARSMAINALMAHAFSK